MNIPNNVRRHLATCRGQYKMRAVDPAGTLDQTIAAAGLDASKVARATVVKSGKAYLVAVTPADRELDLDRLAQMFKRPFALASREELLKLFPDCDPDALPPLAGAYNLKSMQDRNLSDLDHVYFPVGVSGLFVRASGEEFARLQGESWRNHVITREPAQAGAGSAPFAGDRDAIRKQVEKVDGLPAMPGIATEIMRLRNNPYSHASELAAVLEQDPSLSAQLIRYATSPLYGYQGKVDSVQQAIVRVLGMDFVYDIAFGLALGKTFRNPKDGPIGLTAFWNHAMHAGALTQAICNAVEFERRPAPGTAYLAGLLHNFGFLLLGHLFPEQFRRLNSAIEQNPGRPVEDLERETIGVSHTELGLWLMDAWDMPRELIEAVREHHNPHHHSDFSVYANLVYIANALLKRHGIGDAADTHIPDALLSRVGLDSVRVEMALATVMEDNEGLDFMAHRMAA